MKMLLLPGVPTNLPCNKDFPKALRKMEQKVGFFNFTDYFTATQVDWMGVLDLSMPFDRALFVSALVAMVKIIKCLVKVLPDWEFWRTILKPHDRGHGVTLSYFGDR